MSMERHRGERKPPVPPISGGVPADRKSPLPASTPAKPYSAIIYPSRQMSKGRILKMPDENREGLNMDKLSFGFNLPWNPEHTETLFDLEKFEDMDVDKVRIYTHALVLDVDGTLVEHHGNVFQPAVVEKLREIRAKMKVCVFSNNDQEREIFGQLAIPVVKNATPKPSPMGFDRAARHYLQMNPDQCTMVGDNLLTDGGAKQVGMHLILVDPIPGKEGIMHRLTRSYGRMMKDFHDKLFGAEKRKPRAQIYKNLPPKR